MKREKTIYTCNACAATTPRWLGKCPSCGAWNSLVESVSREAAPTKNRFVGLAPSQPISFLSDIEDADLTRVSTGMPEFDRVLGGGGIVQGSVILCAADPGWGKSTLLIQAAEEISKSMGVLYISGEESGSQTRARAKRLGLTGTKIRFMGEIALEKILAAIDTEAPGLVIIDSIQTLYSEALAASPGSVSQVKECAGQLVRVAKSRGISIALIGHVTKTSEVAGPQVLSHQVDTVINGETGDTGSPYRLLRAIKNRFGAPDLGVFAMTEKGLKGVNNPSAIFLSTHNEPVAGSCVVAAMEGTRTVMVEIQALTAPGGPSPRRLSVGLERERLSMLLAVLARHAEISTSALDTYVNAVGGICLSEPATDLAVVLAIVSSITGKPLPSGFVAMGEVGLVGEVRPSPRGADRLREAARLGMTKALIPKANFPKTAIPGLTVYGVDRIEQALAIVRGLD